MHISTTKRVYEKFPQPDLEASDVARLESFQCRPAAFNPLAFNDKNIGIAPSDIVNDRQGFRTTNPQSLFMKQQCLVMALQQRGEEEFPRLWIASLFSEHTVIRNAKSETGEIFYILLRSSELLLTWRLDLADDGILTFSPLPDQFVTFVSSVIGMTLGIF